jgi:hypothetical protein
VETVECKAAAGDPNHAKRPIHGAEADDPCDCGYCHSCHYARKRHRRRQGRLGTVRRQFGLSEADLEALRASQRGRCAICLRRVGVVKAGAVDHDHAIGNVREAVRGLLCSTCNRWLGHVRDDPGAGLRAAAYLIDPPAQKVLTTLDRLGQDESR